MSYSSYVNTGDRSRLLNKEDRIEIYNAFGAYERWKIKQGAYDLMDVVNYILIQIQYGRYRGIPIHYIMVDEV